MPKPQPNGPTTWDPAKLPMPMDIGAFMSMSRPALVAMAELNGKLADNALKMGAEWADFVRRRLEEDIAVPQRFVACKTPQEAQTVYVDYWKTAFAQYQDEIGRLTRMSQKFTEQTATAMRKHAEQVTQETHIAP